MDSVHASQPISVVSARADGATTVSLGLAAVLGARSRTVLVDLNLENRDVAPFLDLEETKTVYHLAYGAQLAPIADEELLQHLQWHDGFAVLPGITHPHHREQITPHFVSSLLQALRGQFEHLVVDAGRIRPSLPDDAVAGTVLWVVSPRPLGMAAFDRAYRALEEANTPWLPQTHVVLSRMSADALAEVPNFIRTEYGLSVLAELPDCPRFWSRAELSHSLRALSVPMTDRSRLARTYGEEALRLRSGLEALVTRLSVPAPAAQTVTATP